MQVSGQSNQKKRKLPAWDGVTALPYGVNREDDGRGWHGYTVFLEGGKRKRVKDLQTALNMRKSYNDNVAALKASQTQQEKRALNIGKHGSDAELERAFAMRLAAAFVSCGWQCIILNDFTLADIIVRPNGEGDLWYWVQLKTTRGMVASSKRWIFGGVNKYGHMLVCCHALSGGVEDKPRSWVYDGRVLQKHLPGGCLQIGPNSVWGKGKRLVGKCESVDMDTCMLQTALVLVRSLVAGSYPRTTECEARWALTTPAYFLEYAGLNLLMRIAEESQDRVVSLPAEQGPHHDLVETFHCDGKRIRLQCKSAFLRCRDADGNLVRDAERATHAGLHVNLQKSAGWGVTSQSPYDDDDFDVLAVVWRDLLCDTWRVWRIPNDAIPRSKNGKLVKGMHVHVPRDVPLPPGVDRVEAHGPPPRLENTEHKPKRRGSVSKSYHLTSVLCKSYPMRDEWEPPVPWPKELARHQRS